MLEAEAQGLNIVVVTNVGPTILRSYFRPLAQLDGVRSLTVVRDTVFEPFAPNVEWLSSGTSSRNAAVRIVTRAARVVRCLARKRVDILMVMHWFPDGFYVYPLARASHVPLVAHIIGGTAEIDAGARKLALSQAPSLLKRVGEVATRRLLNGVAGVTFTGTATLARFRSRGVSIPRLSVARPLVPVDIDTAPLSERTVDIVYVGRIDADKRFDRFLHVLAALGARRRSVLVRVCGISREEVARHPETREIAIPDSVSVEYVGRIPDVLPNLRVSRVFMLTSDSEGLSLAMLEAMGCGTVPVVTDVGDIGAVLGEARSGAAIPVGVNELTNVRLLTDAAESLLDDDEGWRRQSAAGHSYVAARHSMAGTQSDWERILEPHFPRRRPARSRQSE